MEPRRLKSNGINVKWTLWISSSIYPTLNGETQSYRYLDPYVGGELVNTTKIYCKVMRVNCILLPIPNHMSFMFDVRSTINHYYIHPVKRDIPHPSLPLPRAQCSGYDESINVERAWLLLVWVTAERSCPCKQSACPAVGGGSEVTFKRYVFTLPSSALQDLPCVYSGSSLVGVQWNKSKVKLQKEKERNNCTLGSVVGRSQSSAQVTERCVSHYETSICQRQSRGVFVQTDQLPPTELLTYRSWLCEHIISYLYLDRRVLLRSPRGACHIMKRQSVNVRAEVSLSR
ncbi:hypothetical protein J6590_024998 [Homalodisca vitripennis]|nr:hypothetical protein J6590_024998 [Homalodisca vitripennis]